ncbi:MAG: cell division protein FtsL [Thermodesulfobacteriota bacterium]
MTGKEKQMKAAGIRTLSLWLAVVLLLTGEAFCCAWCRVQSVDLRYEITRNTAEAEKLAARHRDLEIEMARLRSPSRIMEIAKTRLGMIMPVTNQVVFIP